MKYQQLNNLESGWKYAYLMKQHREGKMITCHIENTAAQEAIRQLFKLEKEPEKVIAWINQHINLDLHNCMKHAIRARRKRYFNAENQHTWKKSIDLEFLVWQCLSILAHHYQRTLSETLIQLIEDAEYKKNMLNKYPL